MTNYVSYNLRVATDVQKIAQAKAWFIHCINLYTLFEYAIPVIQDYGTCIKLNSVDTFMKCFEKLLRLLIMFHSSGSNMYSRSMVMFFGKWQYWDCEECILVTITNFFLVAYERPSSI